MGKNGMPFSCRIPLINTIICYKKTQQQPKKRKVRKNQGATCSGTRGHFPRTEIKDLYTGDTLWFLNKAMNGTREASKCWGEKVKGTMVQEGFHAVETVPGIYRHEEWDVTVSCHGDDFLAEGCTDGLDRLDAVMTKGFEVKILPRIGAQESGGMVQEGRHDICIA